MPLPLTVSCFSEIQIGFTFWYRLTWVVPGKGPLNGCVYAVIKKTLIRREKVIVSLFFYALTALFRVLEVFGFTSR